MGFTLIKGAFHLDVGNPDGDSVRFARYEFIFLGSGELYDLLNGFGD